MSEVSQLAALIERESGIRLDQRRYPLLAAAADRVAPELSIGGLFDALAGCPADHPLLRRLIDEVTVNETFFFRHADELFLLDWHALAEAALARGSSAIRVWVAGCSSGEEAYTLAMLAHKSFAPEAPPVTIVATDISDSVLTRARRGEYSARATRAVPAELRQRYFAPVGDRLSVSSTLRRMVRFERHNLTRDTLPAAGPFELITCRNTLIYFDADVAARVVGSFNQSLAPGGQLILGAADRISARPSAPARPTTDRPVRRSQPRPRPERRRRLPVVDASPAPAAGSPSPEDAIRAAADAGRLEEVIALTGAVLAQNPLDARASFMRGLAELGAGNPQAAAVSLRRAVYAEPGFGMAAFKLGRALELCGERAGAIQAYRQALRAISRSDDADPSDSAATSDVAAACRLRLRTLTTPVAVGEEMR